MLCRAAWLSQPKRVDGTGTHHTTLAVEWFPLPPPAVAPGAPAHSLADAVPKTEQPAGAPAAAAGTLPPPGGVSDTARPTTPVLEPARPLKRSVVRVGDTVHARSSVVDVAAMTVALVEDMWQCHSTDPAALPLSVHSCRVRLRWFSTIHNISISRARLPRGSQVRRGGATGGGYCAVAARARQIR